MGPKVVPSMPLQPSRWETVRPPQTASPVKSSTTSFRYTAVITPSRQASMPGRSILSASKMAV